MKTHPLIPTTCALVLGVSLAVAGEYPVTPSTLDDWQLTGPAPAVAGVSSSLVLPGGAALSRKFAGTTAVLYSVSTPSFGATPADWPVLQVGPAALALTRSGERGRLVLLVGNTVSTLPVEIALDDAGRSAAPLELAVGYSAASRRGIVMAGGQVREFASDVPDTLGVTVSAGEGEPWPHESLVVVVPDIPSQSSVRRLDRSAGAATASSALQASAEILRRMAAPPSANETPAQADAGAPASGTARPAARPVALEIFTPPAVRHGPAAVRAEIARQKHL